MKYPKYVFLTYGSYEFQWWATQNHKVEHRCSPEDIAEVLQFSLAALHFHIPAEEGLFYQSCYDTTWTLAYALNEVIKDVDISESWQDAGTSTSASASGSGCGQTTDHSFRNESIVPMLMKQHLEATNFVGLSVRSYT